jgi:hypothetical protein
MTNKPKWFSAGDFNAMDAVWKKKILVKKRIASSSKTAVKLLSTPITAANAESLIRRLSREKSPPNAAPALDGSSTDTGHARPSVEPTV